MVWNRCPLVIHLDKYLIPKSNETVGIKISTNLWKTDSRIPDYMLIIKLRTVFIESIGNKDWNIILPLITRSC